MKIAIVYDMIYPFNIGGVEIRNYETAVRLAKNHEVHLFGVKLWKGPDVIKKDGLVLHGVCRYKDLYGFKGTRTIIEPIKFAAKLFRHLRNEKFDIIETASFPYFHCFTCKLVSMSSKTPLVFTWHQYWADYWYKYLGFFKGLFGKNIERMVKILTKNHVAVSKTTKKDMAKAGICRKRISVIYNGVDIKKINSIKPQDKIYDIIFVGRLVHQKNVQLLIKSVSLLKKELPKIKVCIIGDGHDKENLEKMAKKFGLENNIVFKGFVNEKEEVYRNMKSSKIFVLPSLLEGFGIVVVEANACGLPVIVVDNKWNASTELIDDNGLIVKNKPEELANGIRKLLKDENLTMQMGESGIKKAKQFDWEIITRKLENYYQGIVNENRAKLPRS